MSKWTRWRDKQIDGTKRALGIDGEHIITVSHNIAPSVEIGKEPEILSPYLLFSTIGKFTGETLAEQVKKDIIYGKVKFIKNLLRKSSTLPNFANKLTTYGVTIGDSPLQLHVGNTEAVYVNHVIDNFRYTDDNTGSDVVYLDRFIHSELDGVLDPTRWYAHYTIDNIDYMLTISRLDIISPLGELFFNAREVNDDGTYDEPVIQLDEVVTSDNVAELVRTSAYPNIPIKLDGKILNNIEDDGDFSLLQIRDTSKKLVSRQVYDAISDNFQRGVANDEHTEEEKEAIDDKNDALGHTKDVLLNYSLNLDRDTQTTNRPVFETLKLMYQDYYTGQHDNGYTRHVMFNESQQFNAIFDNPHKINTLYSMDISHRTVSLPDQPSSSNEVEKYFEVYDAKEDKYYTFKKFEDLKNRRYTASTIEEYDESRHSGYKVIYVKSKAIVNVDDDLIMYSHGRGGQKITESVVFKVRALTSTVVTETFFYRSRYDNYKDYISYTINYKKKVNNGYEIFSISLLEVTKTIFKNNEGHSSSFSMEERLTGVVDKGSLVLPLIGDLVFNKLGFSTKYKLIDECTHIITLHYVDTYIEWYKTSKFLNIVKVVMYIIAIVIMVYTIGTASSVSAGIIAVAQGLAISIAVGLAVKWVFEHTDNKWIRAVAVIIAVVVAIYVGDTTTLSTLTTMDVALAVINAINLYVNVSVSVDGEKVMKEIQEMEEEYNEYISELDKQIEVMDESDGSMLVQIMLDFKRIEEPNEFYARILDTDAFENAYQLPFNVLDSENLLRI